jgi:hypothetical protein
MCPFVISVRHSNRRDTALSLIRNQAKARAQASTDKPQAIGSMTTPRTAIRVARSCVPKTAPIRIDAAKTRPFPVQRVTSTDPDPYSEGFE